MDERDRGLQKVQNWTMGLVLAAASLVAVFAALAAASFPGHTASASGAPAAASPDDRSSSDQPSSDQPQAPPGGFFNGGGGGGGGRVATGGS